MTVPPSCEVCGTRMRPQWQAPLGSSTDRQAPSDAEAMQKAPVAVHHRSACSGVKALRNTSVAKAASRQAPLAFRSLDPFRALREPDRRRRDEKRPFPLRTKNCQHNPKQPLDSKSPIQVRIPSLQPRIFSSAASAKTQAARSILTAESRLRPEDDAGNRRQIDDRAVAAFRQKPVAHLLDLDPSNFCRRKVVDLYVHRVAGYF